MMKVSSSVVVTLLPFVVAASVVRCAEDLTTTSSHRRKLSKGKGSKINPPKPGPPPPEAPLALHALIEPVEDGTTFGTTTVRFNPDGAFLVSLDLNFLSGTDRGEVVITHGTSCDVASPQFSDVPFDDFELATNQYQAIGSYETGNAISLSAFRCLCEDQEKPADFIDKTVHIVDAAGNLIGCGPLEKEPPQMKVLTADVGRYPGYEGDLRPSGTITVTYTEGNAGNTDDFVYAYDLQGVLANCDTCGIHIHAGTSCATNELVKGHGWNTDKVEDLWTPVGGAFYNADNMGHANSYFHMNNGFGILENLHHAVVVHTEGGARVGCGILKYAKS